MQIFHSLAEFHMDQPVVLSLGVFDGLHKGHRKVLDAALQMANARNASAGVLTFYPHPMAVLAPEIPLKYLMDEREKESAFAEMGFESEITIRPTKEFLDLQADEFLHLLSNVPHLAGLVTGENFSFGRKAEGNAKHLADYFQNSNIDVDIVQLALSEGERPVSSTLIRESILKGDVRNAAEMLGRSYSLSGDVVHGYQRGKSVLGFPTANLEPASDRVIPADGVYATEAVIGGRRFPSITNIGTNPTFDNPRKSIETFIFSFDESIYGAAFEVDFAEKIRDEMKFDSAEELKAQIEKDISEAKEILGCGNSFSERVK